MLYNLILNTSQNVTKIENLEIIQTFASDYFKFHDDFCQLYAFQKLN